MFIVDNLEPDKKAEMLKFSIFFILFSFYYVTAFDGKFYLICFIFLQFILISYLNTFINYLPIFIDCAVGGIESVLGDCQKYRFCQTINFGSLFGVWEEYSCPEGFSFDSNSNACLQAKDTDCYRKFSLIRQ